MLPFILLSLVCANDPEPPNPKAGPGPQLVEARVAKGKLISRKVEYLAQVRTVTKKVNVNGQATDVTETIQVMVPVMQETTYDISKAALRTADGKQVTMADLEKKATSPIVMLLANGSGGLDAYLRVLKPETVVIIQPSVTPAIGKQAPPK